jgi:hypothetical protein
LKQTRGEVVVGVAVSNVPFLQQTFPETWSLSITAFPFSWQQIGGKAAAAVENRGQQARISSRAHPTFQLTTAPSTSPPSSASTPRVRLQPFASKLFACIAETRPTLSPWPTQTPGPSSRDTADPRLIVRGRPCHLVHGTVHLCKQPRYVSGTRFASCPPCAHCCASSRIASPGSGDPMR